VEQKEKTEVYDLPLLIDGCDAWQFTYMFVSARPGDASSLKFPQKIADFLDIKEQYLTKVSPSLPLSSRPPRGVDTTSVMFDVYVTYVAKKMREAIESERVLQ
jgi:hypothetical protein